MQPITISKATARRFVLGRQGLWPGRRWAGKEGTAEALRAVEAVQMDPLNVVARSHDIVLWGRVLDYRPALLETLLYSERQFFDYGGWLAIYPMAELPFWRLHMRHRAQEQRWSAFAAEHGDLIDEVREAVESRGPTRNRDFTGRSQVNSYRGRKDSALALYYLWLTGELMTHHREGFERVYDLRARVAPQEYDTVAADETAEAFFVRKSTAFRGLITERGWRLEVASFLERPLTVAEARAWMERLLAQGELVPVTIEGSPERWFALGEDVELLTTIEAGRIPASWQPLATTTTEEMVFFSPLEIVSARGRSTWLFEFEHLCEFYKPAEKRRWGYYTLPILYGDRLVARLDPKLERASRTLVINGFWLEPHAPAADPAFAQALARGLLRFADFLEAQAIDLAAIGPDTLRERVAGAVRSSLEIKQ